MLESIFKSKRAIRVVVLLLVLMAIGLMLVFTWQRISVSEKRWSVIYLATGEIYVGKISHFLRFRITRETYILQVVKVPAEEEGMEPKTSFQLTPIQDALWAPEKLYLNREQVVFYGPVLETSKVGEAIREAGQW